MYTFQLQARRATRHNLILACPQGTATGLLHETVLYVRRTRMPTAGEGSGGAQIKASFSGSQAMPLGLQVPCPEGGCSALTGPAREGAFWDSSIQGVPFLNLGKGLYRPYALEVGSAGRYSKDLQVTKEHMADNTSRICNLKT